MFRKKLITKTGHEILIQEALREDATPLLEYIHQISEESDFLTFGPGEFTMTLEQEEAYLEKSLQTENCIYLLAIIEKKIVGSLNYSGGGRPRTQHTGEFGMSVLRDFQGQGIGAILLDALLEWGVSNPIVKKINLRVRSDNDIAISLYLSRNFQEEGRISREMYINDQYYDNMWMGIEV